MATRRVISPLADSHFRVAMLFVAVERHGHAATPHGTRLLPCDTVDLVKDLIAIPFDEFFEQRPNGFARVGACVQV